MSDNKPQTVGPDGPVQTPKQQLGDIEAARDLFARAHDYISQANHPGHLGMKVAEVLNFLKFQYESLKVRGENMAKQIESDAKAELSKVDVKAAESKVAEVLGGTNPTPAAPSQPVNVGVANQPKS